jgi:hypothetical protein
MLRQARSVLSARVGLVLVAGAAVAGSAFVAKVAAFPAGPPPTISTFSQTKGCPGRAVEIEGTNFSGANAVKFNGVNAASFHVKSAQDVIAVVAPGTTTGHIAVTTPNGTGTSANNFTIEKPKIGSLNPKNGPVGTQTAIRGSCLFGATAVSFNGTPAAGFTVDSDLQITATIAGGTTTGRASVTSPSGTTTARRFRVR